MSIKFDHDQPYEKHRIMGLPPTYTQNGRHFDSGFRYVGKGSSTHRKEAREKKKAAARDTAADKLKGFTESASTADSVISAKKEDMRARLAEDNAA
jgi:hypothetical protein